MISALQRLHPVRPGQQGDVRAAQGDRAELQHGRWGALHFVYFDPLEGEELIGELMTSWILK